MEPLFLPNFPAFFKKAIATALKLDCNVAQERYQEEKGINLILP